MTLPANTDDMNYEGGQLFEWVEGMPRPRRKRAMGKEQIQAIHNAAAALPYKGVWNPLTQRFEQELDYEGLTQAEVAILKQWEKASQGDTKAYEKLMDRMLGKPKQAVETVSMKLSYQEVLDLMSERDVQEGIVVDVPSSPLDGSVTISTPYLPGSIFNDPDEDDDEESLDDLLEGV